MTAGVIQPPAVIGAHSPFLAAAVHPEIFASTVRIFIVVADLLGNKWRPIKFAPIASLLGMKPSTVSASVDALCRHGFLERRGKGPRFEYRLTSPEGQ